jgi:hypothetical protein
MSTSGTASRAGRLLGALLVVVSALLGVGALTATAQAAPVAARSAAPAPADPAALARQAAAALRTAKVYVDPAQKLLTPDQVEQVRKDVEAAATPIYLAVLPDVDDPEKASALPDRIGRLVRKNGTYAVLAGGLSAASTVLAPGDAPRIAREAWTTHQADAPGALAEFVDRVETSASQSGPAGAGRDVTGTRPFEPSAEQGSSNFAFVLLFLVLLGGAGAFLMVRKSNQTKRRREQAELAQVRTAVDEDITSYGEELDRLDFSPAAPGVDDHMRADYSRALDAYEEAKTRIAAARRPEDVRQVSAALEDGRFALATLQARREGRELPERRPPCFFDPRHGPSVTDAEWAPPPDGQPRPVPVCAADASRLADGLPPMVREVEMAGGGRRPYWDAGPAYGPWAGGYFGGYGSMLLPGLLVGTLLGSSFAGGGMFGDGFGYGGEGDVGGGDVGGGDFGGGDFGGGDFGGGDF